MVAVPVTVSMTLDERDHLDAWARAHDMTRSAAIRSVIRQLRWPGQERLDSFSGSPPPKAFAELVEASEAASRARQADTQPPEPVADAEPGPECYNQPSSLLKGKCAAGPMRFDANKRAIRTEYVPEYPACPACWPEGTTIKDVRRMAGEALRREREAQVVADAQAIYDAIRKED